MTLFANKYLNLLFLSFVTCTMFLFASGCNEEQNETKVVSNVPAPVPVSGTISIKLVVDLNSPNQSRLFSAAGTFGEVTTITVAVKEAEGDQAIVSQTSLFESPVGSAIWEGVITNLPVGINLDFEAQALNVQGEVIFTDTIVKTLTSEDTGGLQGEPGEEFNIKLTFELESVDDGVQPDNPTIESAVIPEEIERYSNSNILKFRIGHPAAVEYELEVDYGTITSPITGFHDPAGDLIVTYDAPEFVTIATISLWIKDPSLTDRIGSTFTINIIDSDPPLDVDVVFGPAITAVQFVREPDKLMIWAETDPEAGLSYLWSGTGSFSSVAATSNPLVIDGFTDQMTGDISVTITDNLELSASLSRTIQSGDFPYVIETPEPNPEPPPQPNPSTPDGTYLDLETSLLWQDNVTQHRLRWNAAKTYCEEVVETGGYTDWRLPTIEELGTAYGLRQSFASYLDKGYWSISSYGHLHLRAWYLRFNTGTERVGIKLKKLGVRCVRNW